MAEAHPKTVMVPCGNCGGDHKRHDVLVEHSRNWSGQDPGDDCGGVHFQICQCRGCDRVRFRQEDWTETPEAEDDGYRSTVAVYPEADTSRHAPTETELLPSVVSRIYIETIRALNAGTLILAGAGLRAIVEAICKDQKVSGGNLAEKIDDLVTKCLLAKPQADLLHEERFIGNAAIHELLPPSTRDLELGLSIVEGLVKTIYVLPIQAERLRKKRLDQKPPAS
jgi:hypothetical protein